MKTQINMNELLEDLDNGAEINEALTAKEIAELKELDVREIAEALAKEELEEVEEKEVDFDSLEAALETAFERDDEENPCLDPCITIDEDGYCEYGSQIHAGDDYSFEFSHFHREGTPEEDAKAWAESLKEDMDFEDWKDQLREKVVEEKEEDALKIVEALEALENKEDEED